MQYLVQGSDGKEYGPVDVDVLKQWVGENRITPQTVLRDFHTGQSVAATSISGLFAAVPAGPYAAPPAPYASYPHPLAQPYKGAYSGYEDGKWDVVWAIVRSMAAIVFFFFLHGIGLIFAIYGVVYAFRANEKGHRLGGVAIAISILALVIVVLGWILRLQSVGGR